MFSFFYDSLDTLKKVKKPTLSEVKDITIVIFVVVVISGIIFAFMDGVSGEVYKEFYNLMSA